MVDHWNKSREILGKKLYVRYLENVSKHPLNTKLSIFTKTLGFSYCISKSDFDIFSFLLHAAYSCGNCRCFDAKIFLTQPNILPIIKTLPITYYQIFKSQFFKVTFVNKIFAKVTRKIVWIANYLFFDNNCQFCFSKFLSFFFQISMDYKKRCVVICTMQCLLKRFRSYLFFYFLLLLNPAV